MRRVKVFTIKPSTHVVSEMGNLIFKWLNNSRPKILREALGENLCLCDAQLLRRDIINLWGIYDHVSNLLPRFVEICTIVNRLYEIFEKHPPHLEEYEFKLWEPLYREIRELWTMCHGTDLTVTYTYDHVEKFRNLKEIMLFLYQIHSDVYLKKFEKIGSMIENVVNEFLGNISGVENIDNVLHYLNMFYMDRDFGPCTYLLIKKLKSLRDKGCNILKQILDVDPERKYIGKHSHVDYLGINIKGKLVGVELKTGASKAMPRLTDKELKAKKVLEEVGGEYWVIYVHLIIPRDIIARVEVFK